MGRWDCGLPVLAQGLGLVASEGCRMPGAASSEAGIFSDWPRRSRGLGAHASCPSPAPATCTRSSALSPGGQVCCVVHGSPGAMPTTRQTRRSCSSGAACSAAVRDRRPGVGPTWRSSSPSPPGSPPTPDRCGRRLECCGAGEAPPETTKLSRRCRGAPGPDVCPALTSHSRPSHRPAAQRLVGAEANPAGLGRALECLGVDRSWAGARASEAGDDVDRTGVQDAGVTRRDREILRPVPVEVWQGYDAASEEVSLR